MDRAMVLSLISCLLMVAGVLGQAWGITTPVIDRPEILEPTGGFVANLLGAMIYVFNAVASVAQLMVVQFLTGTADAVLGIPMAIFCWICFIGLIRGGGV